MQTWPAPLTTVAVFIPVVFMKEEVGQLFGDIAIGLGCSVMLSLLVSMTVVPCLSARILSSAAQVIAGTTTCSGSTDWANASQAGFPAPWRGSTSPRCDGWW